MSLDEQTANKSGCDLGTGVNQQIEALLRMYLSDVRGVVDGISRAQSHDHDILVRVEERVMSMASTFEHGQKRQAVTNDDVEGRVKEIERVLVLLMDHEARMKKTETDIVAINTASKTVKDFRLTILSLITSTVALGGLIYRILTDTHR